MLWCVLWYCVLLRWCVVCFLVFPCFDLSLRFSTCQVLRFSALALAVKVKGFFALPCITLPCLALCFLMLSCFCVFLSSSCLVSSHLISSHLISSHLISSHLISSHLISHHLTSPHLTSFHPILSCLAFFSVFILSFFYALF